MKITFAHELDQFNRFIMVAILIIAAFAFARFFDQATVSLGKLIIE